MLLTAAGLGLGVASVVVLWADGRLPAPLPQGVDEVRDGALLAALTAVDSSGEVSRERLRSKAAALDEYLQSVAAVSPRSRPELFPTPEARIAYWLNVFHALVLRQLRDDGALSWWLGVQPVGGQRLTLAAVFRRYLEATEDPRVVLSLYTGPGTGWLDGAPFAEALLDAQLNDATRRYFRRRDTLALEGKRLLLPRLVGQLEPFIRRVLPPGHALPHFVWAYLPDTCEGLYPGCLTRLDLDLACGRSLDGCKLAFR